MYYLFIFILYYIESLRNSHLCHVYMLQSGRQFLPALKNKAEKEANICSAPWLIFTFQTETSLWHMEERKVGIWIFFFFNKMRFLYIYFIGYLSVANWIQYSSKIEISLRDTIYIYRDRLLRIYFPAGFWKCWPCCHDIVTSPIFLMRLHISQSLEPICGTTSTAWIDLNLHLSGECSNVSYEAVLWMFKQAFHTAGSRKILP